MINKKIQIGLPEIEISKVFYWIENVMGQHPLRITDFRFTKYLVAWPKINEGGPFGHLSSMRLSHHETILY